MLNGLSLFSGIGGLDVALSEWVRPITYCEIDPYCQSILLSRMQEGNLPKAPIWDDITTLRDALFDSGLIYTPIDIVYGGFPCQDISFAGNGKGLEGKRSSLFFEIVRISKEVKPKFIFLENVAGITTKGGLRVVREIAEMGYDCRWCVISAAGIGTLHRRERWFLLANAKHIRPYEGSSMESFKETISNHKKGKEETFESTRSYTQRMLSSNKEIRSQETSFFESTVCRTTDGVPYRMDRIKALGNSVVPQQAKKAFEILM